MQKLITRNLIHVYNTYYKLRIINGIIKKTNYENIVFLHRYTVRRTTVYSAFLYSVFSVFTAFSRTKTHIGPYILSFDLYAALRQ